MLSKNNSNKQQILLFIRIEYFLINVIDKFEEQ